MAADKRDETELERADRNLNEMLQELRIALPGVQVLFAFLLAVPFQRRFDEVTSFQRSVFFVTLLFTAISTLFLIAPTAFHRITFRRQMKETLLPFSNNLAIAGLVFLALAMVGAVTLVTDFLYGSTATIIVASLTAVLLGLFWGLVPLQARRHSNDTG